jgi:hypothetical protein
MATAAPRARPGNLTAALAAFAVLELLLNRLANRLFLPQSTISGGAGGSRGAHLVAASGPLLFHLTGVLALVVLLAAVAGLLRRGELFPRGMRFSMVVIGLSFWLLCAYAVVFGMVPARFFPHVEVFFGLLSLLIALASLGAPTQGRVKVGIALFIAPGILQAAAIVGDRMGMVAGGVTGSISRAGELALLAACLAAPVLLPPRPARERPWRFPLAVAVVGTAGLAAGIAVRFDLLQATLLYGLRLELPPLGSALGLGYLAAFFCWVYTTSQLLIDKGGMRLAGYGLVLLAVAGYPAPPPLELVLALLGVLALSVGELRAAPYGRPGRNRVGNEAWRGYVGRLATAAGDGTSPDDSRSEAVVVEEGELEVCRIRAHRRGLPVAMRLLRRRGALVELEATIGEATQVGPDASIERHRSWLQRPPAERARLPRVKTGDAAFDQRLSVHGQAPLGDPALRRNLLLATGDGVVFLWKGTAARYHVRGDAAVEDRPAPFSGEVEGEAPVRNVVAALDTLADLLEASGSG